VTAIVCMIAGQFGYVYAIGNLSPTVVSAFENVLPVTTVVLSIFIFGKMLTVPQLIGAVLIMASVTVIALKSEENNQ
jgi:drug/metabolite transporter (DMT)-like permease